MMSNEQSVLVSDTPKESFGQQAMSNEMQFTS
jgi:hypothetical protein